MNHEHQDLESRLRQLAPRRHSLRRDTILFEAGRRAARNQLHRWRAASGALLLAIVFLGWHEWSPDPRASAPAMVQVEMAPDHDLVVVTPVVPVTDRLPAPPSVAGAGDYVRLRNLLVMQGADALPLPPAYAELPDTAELLLDWQDMPADSGSQLRRFLNLKPRTYGDPS